LINRYLAAAAIIIVVIFGSYFLNFYVSIEYGLSNDPAIWAQLGDYAGGMLAPCLSFVTIIILIKSLALQNEANTSLKEELKKSEQMEKLKSFEVLFFNMIESQKRLFESFNIEFSSPTGGNFELSGVNAVIAIEDEIAAMRDIGSNEQDICLYLENIDKKDQIFGLSRAFYIMVLSVSDKLSVSNGFSIDDRRAHFQTLVNFTDFAQLRLILICVQFTNYESAKYIRFSNEFKDVIEELKLGFELY
jgi:hypothetical protein